MKYFKIEDIKDWYDRKKRPSFLAIHIENKSQYNILKEFMPELDTWVKGCFWYLESAGHCAGDNPYPEPEYKRIEFSQIIFREIYQIY